MPTTYRFYTTSGSAHDTQLAGFFSTPLPTPLSPNSVLFLTSLMAAFSARTTEGNVITFRHPTLVAIEAIPETKPGIDLKIPRPFYRIRCTGGAEFLTRQIKGLKSDDVTKFRDWWEAPTFVDPPLVTGHLKGQDRLTVTLDNGHECAIAIANIASIEALKRA